jgi:hypothetical protein
LRQADIDDPRLDQREAIRHYGACFGGFPARASQARHG